MEVCWGSWVMRIFALLMCLLVLSFSSAQATTYDYSGAELSVPPTAPANECPFGCVIPGISGFVTFAGDTSNFSGTLTLAPGDRAVFSDSFISFVEISYPVNNPPPGDGINTVGLHPVSETR
jgi:hypothetical protein